VTRLIHTRLRLGRHFHLTVQIAQINVPSHYNGLPNPSFFSRNLALNLSVVDNEGVTPGVALFCRPEGKED